MLMPLQADLEIQGNKYNLHRNSMNLDLKNKHFVVCGASSGFGLAIAKQLLEEGARVTAVARDGNKLRAIYKNTDADFVEGSLIYSDTLDKIEAVIKKEQSYGIVFNAGGPPAGSALDSNLSDLDSAYQLVMRWKVDLALRCAPFLSDLGRGRMLFIESQSVKQPIPNLVLSNTFRAGIAGFAKTLSQEIASKGVTVNVLAPGSHETPAIERIIQNRSNLLGITKEQAKKEMQGHIPVGRFGTAEEFATLATWLLSPLSGYVTGQVISHDGGNIAGLFG